MENVTTLNVRPSDLLLDRVLNPTRDADIGSATPALIIEACGIIPDFFAAACCSTSEALTLDIIAAGMDAEYQMGGFRYPFGGSLTAAGIYQSSYEDDLDMSPLACFTFEGFECFVYHYGITAIRDRATGEAKIARFD